MLTYSTFHTLILIHLLCAQSCFYKAQLLFYSKIFKLTTVRIHVTFFWNGGGWDKNTMNMRTTQMHHDKHHRYQNHNNNKKVNIRYINKAAWHSSFWSFAMNMDMNERAGKDQCFVNKSKLASWWVKRRTALMRRQRSCSDTYLSWRWRTWRSSERWFVFSGKRRSSSSLSCCPSPQRERSRGLHSSP